MKSLCLIFVDYPKTTEEYQNQKEHYLSTYVPEDLAPLVERVYHRNRPDLDPPHERMEVDAVKMDSHGPIYGGGDVTVTTQRGYSVTCPLSHADVVAQDILTLSEAEPHFVVDGVGVTVYRSMHTLAALYHEDLTEIANALEQFALGAYQHRQVFRSTLSTDPHVEVVKSNGVY